MLGRLMEIKQLMNGQTPEVLYNQMLRNNPQFVQFIANNRGKTPEQIAQENGIDPAVLRQLLR